MQPITRRIFFKHAGALAAASAIAGTVVSAPAGIAGAATAVSGANEAELAPREHLGAHDTIVAHVTNTRTGEITLLRGHREVTFRDRKLAARLVRQSR